MDVRFCRAGIKSREANVAQRQILIKPIARSPERAQKPCALLLTMTYMDARHSATVLKRFNCGFIGRAARWRGGPRGLHSPASLRGGRVISGEVGPSLRFVELAVGAEEDVDRLGGEGRFVLPVRGGLGSSKNLGRALR
jgi:hypothetical protein